MSSGGPFSRVVREVGHRVPQRLSRLGRRVFAKTPPQPGSLDLGDFRRVTPVSPTFGSDRGKVIDRYYIEKFLKAYRDDVAGRVLEVGDNNYTLRFGGEAVCVSDVLHVEQGNPLATIVADLAAENDIPSDTFDCIIFTHVIQMIYDQERAVRELFRILKPGGVLLLSTHGTSRVGRRSAKDNWAVYWRITTDTAERLYGDVFGSDAVAVHGHGNVLVAAAFLYGLAAQELTNDELDSYDPDYQVLINVRAVKRAA